MITATTRTPEDYERAGWKAGTCGYCRGTGQEAYYSYGDFEGPEECPNCDGNGALWETPKGRVVRYPGGPFSSGWLQG